MSSIKKINLKKIRNIFNLTQAELAKKLDLDKQTIVQYEAGKNIPLFKVYMSEKAPEAVTKVLESGFIGQGPKVDDFEDKLNDFFKNDYVATSTGH